jgi:hypothetical protein
MFFGCFSDVFGMFLGCVSDVFGMCFGCVWDVFGLCLGCFLAVFGLFLGCFWAVFGMFLGCFWDVFGLCLGCVWLFLGCFLDMFGLCLVQCGVSNQLAASVLHQHCSYSATPMIMSLDLLVPTPWDGCKCLSLERALPESATQNHREPQGATQGATDEHRQPQPRPLCGALWCFVVFCGAL